MAGRKSFQKWARVNAPRLTHRPTKGAPVVLRGPRGIKYGVRRENTKARDRTTDRARVAEREFYLGRGRPCILFLDTNILLEAPDVHLYNAGYSDVTFVILEAVLKELQGLRRSTDPSLRSQAVRAWSNLQMLRGQRASALGLPAGRHGHRVRFEPESMALGSATEQVDQVLVDQADAEQRRKPEAVVAVLTRDRGVCDRARLAGVDFLLVSGPFSNQVLQRLVRGLVGA